MTMEEEWGEVEERVREDGGVVEEMEEEHDIEQPVQEMIKEEELEERENENGRLADVMEEGQHIEQPVL